MILGISLGYNASACIISDDGKLLYSGSEERFNNRKNTKMFPMLSIKNGIESLNLNVEDINACYYSHYQNYDIYDLYRHNYNINDIIETRAIKQNRSLYKEELLEKSFIEQHLYMLGIECETIERVNHHLSHAYCSYSLFESKGNNNLYIVMDGFGDGLSISAYRESVFGLSKIYELPMCKSIALLYQFVTGALGFKEHQHEGKITGLASFGKPIYYNELKELFENFSTFKNDSNVYSPIIDFNIFEKMKKSVYSFVNNLLDKNEQSWETFENISSSLQNYTEDYVIDIVKDIIDKCDLDCCDLYLSGGLFANVKLNQHIIDRIKNVNNIFIAPCMGDEGTCIGAVMSNLYPMKCVDKMSNKTMRIGTQKLATINDIPENIRYDLIEDIDVLADDISKELSENKIVCLFDGKMEFGPRALIGRSILYNCKDKNSNTWLNHQLGRTEFMPFAPFCKEESIDKLFYNTNGKEVALKNMTITVDCKEYFIENCPAACHIDNTARPQVITKDELPIAWKILDCYEKRTGEMALINTSFNLHNFPIIESISNAIYSWLTSNTHCLYINCKEGWYKLYK